MVEYGKVYASNGEFNDRFENYKANMIEAARLNLEEPEGGAEYGETPYSDMSFEEFEERFLGRVGTTPSDAPMWAPRGDGLREEPPTEADFRKEGWVFPIRDQGSCGSCWAFGATATMEGALLRAGVITLEDDDYVSTSLFVDCDHATGNAGCNGGMEWDAFKYAIDEAVVREADYPYVPSTRKCSRDESSMPVYHKFSDRVRGPNGDEEKMVEFAHETGVVSIGIYVNSALMSYKKGIFQAKCPSRVANHAVNLVGWGVEDDVPYWLVRNSWGGRWGEDGYFRIIRGEDKCGIAQDNVQIFITE